MGKSISPLIAGIPAAITTAATFVATDYNLSQLFAALSILLVLTTVRLMHKQMHDDELNQQV